MVALLAVVAVALATVVAVHRASVEAKRQREIQLLWIGDQYRAALRSYHDVNPAGGVQQYPQKLEDLLADVRSPVVRRHIRQIYADPFTGKADWVLEQEGGRIVGLHSRDEGAPLLHAGFGSANGRFSASLSHADWHFLATDTVDYVNVLGTVGSTGSTGGSPLAGADSNASNSTNSTGTGNPTDTPGSTPPPDPVAEARTQCYNEYGTPSRSCRGPSFPAGNSPSSCLMAFAHLLDECLAAAASAN
jgi:hypothetical protein